MGSWIGGFVNPALLAGLGLASVPIVIHLLNRQRHKPMQWAAMRFVLAAHRKTRRRVQMENLLLLLLRTAAIALLALAIARPFTGEKSPLAGMTESRRDVALVIDGSASMGWRESVETVFERALTRAREIVRSLDAGRGDRVRLVYAGQYPRLLSWTTPDQASSMLDALTTPTEEPLDLASALGEVLAAAQKEEQMGARGALEVRLLTDLQRRSFVGQPDAVAAPAGTAGATQPAERTPLFEVLDQLSAAGVRVLVEGLGGNDVTPANLTVSAVHPSGRVLGPDVPAEIRVEVRNYGPTSKSGVRVALEVDGQRRPSESVDIAARGRAEAVFSVAFGTSGAHLLVAAVEDGDHLSVDNARAHVVTVPPAARILLVDGAPGLLIEEDEIGFLRAVLEPSAGDAPMQAAAPFLPRAVAPEELSGSDIDLAQFDVVWLANVESPSAQLVEKLEAWVGRGGALVISAGDRLDATAWNARAFRADGSGLLPAELQGQGGFRAHTEGYQRVAWFDAEHPVLAFFSDERFKPLLTEIPVYEFVQSRPLAGAKVIASLDDDQKSPLLVERGWDRGKVILWTTSIDPGWTRLPESPGTLVPLVHELVRHAAARTRAPRNVSIGSPLAAETELFPRAAVLVRPDGSRRPLDGDAEASGPDRWKLPVVPGKETERSGAYRIETEGAGVVAFAVEMDPAEGDLERATSAEIAKLHPALVPLGDEGGARAGDEPGPERGELWRWIALACLVALVLESAWAAFLGTRRSVRPS